MPSCVQTHAIETFAPMLGTLSKWLDESGAGALVSARLALRPGEIGKQDYLGHIGYAIRQRGGA